MGAHCLPAGHRSEPPPPNCAFLLEKALIFYSFNSGALILSKWKHKGLTRAEPAIHLTSYCDVYL